MNKQLEFRKILNACSFGTVVLIAIALLVHRLNVFPANINAVLYSVAALLGYIVCGASGAMFAITKRKTWVWIVYGLAMMFILILVIMNISTPAV